MLTAIPTAAVIQNCHVKNTLHNGVAADGPSSGAGRAISRSGSPRVLASHAATQSDPAAPTTMKSIRQPSPLGPTIATTRSGVTIAPSVIPLLNIPFARLRASRGRTRGITPTAHGQLNDS